MKIVDVRCAVIGKSPAKQVAQSPMPPAIGVLHTAQQGG